MSSGLNASMSSGIISFLTQHDSTMQQQLELQQEIVLRLKKQQSDLTVWQKRLEQWENRLNKKEETMQNQQNHGATKESNNYETMSASSPYFTTADASLPSSSRRASFIVESMDPKSTGYIFWEQFLAYVRWQENKFGVQSMGIVGNDEEGKLNDEKDMMITSPTRRDSTQLNINTSRYRVRARIELRHIFDGLIDPNDHTHRVSCRELELAVRFSPKCRDLFMPSLLAQHLSDLLKEDFNTTPNQRHQLSARNY